MDLEEGIHFLHDLIGGQQFLARSLFQVRNNMKSKNMWPSEYDSRGPDRSYSYGFSSPPPPRCEPQHCSNGTRPLWSPFLASCPWCCWAGVSVILSIDIWLFENKCTTSTSHAFQKMNAKIFPFFIVVFFSSGARWSTNQRGVGVEPPKIERWLNVRIADTGFITYALASVQGSCIKRYIATRVFTSANPVASCLIRMKSRLIFWMVLMDLSIPFALRCVLL